MRPVAAGARLTIDLNALVANYHHLAALCAPASCAAAVKADAYGLGLAKVLQSLLAAGCNTFFVATVQEGISARQCATEIGFQPVVYVLEGPVEASLAYFAEFDLHPVLNSQAQVKLWSRTHSERAAAIHVDTGMHRLGMLVPEFESLDINGLNISLLISHLACGDEHDNPANAQQLEIMHSTFAPFPNIPKSFAHSAGILLGSQYHADLCRPGIGLYGGNPFVSGANPMQAVVQLEGRIIQSHWHGAGVTVGYGASYQCSRRSLLATVALGYADGLPKSLGNRGRAYFEDQPCNIVGQISMDLTIVDVTPVAGEIRDGDWLEFMGPHISVDEVAADGERFSYEILTRLGVRAERNYLPSNKP